MRGRSPERRDASGGGSRPIWGTLTQFLPGLLSELNSGENSIKDHAARPGAAHGSAARPLGGPHDRSARLRHVLSSAPKVTFHCALRGAPTPRADLRGAAHDGRPPPAAREAKALLAKPCAVAAASETLQAKYSRLQTGIESRHGRKTPPRRHPSHDRRSFAESHEYAKVDGGVATVGITDYAANALGDIVFVDLPEVGDEVEKGEAFGAVESVKAASDVYAPISGEVVEINGALEDTPDLVNSSALEDGWFIKVKMSDAGEVDALMDEAAYAEHTKE